MPAITYSKHSSQIALPGLTMTPDKCLNDAINSVINPNTAVLLRAQLKAHVTVIGTADVMELT